MLGVHFEEAFHSLKSLATVTSLTTQKEFDHMGVQNCKTMFFATALW